MKLITIQHQFALSYYQLGPTLGPVLETVIFNILSATCPTRQQIICYIVLRTNFGVEIESEFEAFLETCDMIILENVCQFVDFHSYSNRFYLYLC